MSFHRSPHYACPEVIRVSITFTLWKKKRELWMYELISNESYCFHTLCSRERSMTEGKQTFGAAGSFSSPCWWWVTPDFTSHKYNISVNNYSHSCCSKPHIHSFLLRNITYVCIQCMEQRLKTHFCMRYFPFSSVKLYRKSQATFKHILLCCWF